MFKLFVHVFLGVFTFSSMSVESSLYILEMSPLPYMWFTNIFALSMACLFILIIVCFTVSGTLPIFLGGQWGPWRKLGPKSGFELLHLWSPREPHSLFHPQWSPTSLLTIPAEFFLDIGPSWLPCDRKSPMDLRKVVNLHLSSFGCCCKDEIMLLPAAK